VAEERPQAEAELTAELRHAFEQLATTRDQTHAEVAVREVGYVTEVGHGIARVEGLPGVETDELLRFPGDLLGMSFNLDPESIGTLLLGEYGHLSAGAEVRRTHRALDVPVGEGVLGRVIDATGRALDDRGSLRFAERRPIERPAPPILHRAPVTVPLQTGIKAIDALVPIGRGQRELILGDRQTGKTAIAIDTIINQRETGVICVYCAIGQRSSSVAKVIAELEQHRAMDYSVVMVATGEDAPGLQFITAYAATTVAEYFMELGRDVLIIYDDLTRHARAYREVSLLLRRPPGREAFPGDVFYIHSRLLERATHMRDEYGGGSLTALPILETEAENLSAYVPTNIISITDGQIYLSPKMFQKGLLPPVSVGTSVSRVGGKTQLSAYRAVAGQLRLAYSQFEELETFARFGTRMDEQTRQRLDRGARVREVLKQPQYSPIPAAEQIAVFVAVADGVLDSVPVESISRAEKQIRQAVAANLPDLCRRIENGEDLTDDDRQDIINTASITLE
jgi:F-type H+/Na+-transporting ATPase subunit alpha